MTATTTSAEPTSLERFAPITADLLGIGFFLLANRWLTFRFQRDAIDFTALQDAGVLLGFHILFLIGITWLRKLNGQPLLPFLQNRLLVGSLTVVYAIAFMFAVADLSSYLNTLFTVNFGDMGNAYYFLVTPAIYLFVGLLYLFILLQSADSTLAPRQFAMPSLLLINLMLVASASYLAAVLPRLFPVITNLPTAVVVYVGLLVLFALPRLIYYAKTRSLISLVSFDLMLIALAFLVGFAG